jgi:hypothetical protein
VVAHGAILAVIPNQEAPWSLGSGEVLRRQELSGILTNQKRAIGPLSDKGFIIEFFL